LFSGIVEEVGLITLASDTSDGRLLRIEAPVVTGALDLGDSVSVSGCCLTVVNFGRGYFEVEVSFQTLRATRLGVLRTGDRVNLERALKLSDRLGGHLVTGHVDGIGHVYSLEQEGFSRLMTIQVDRSLSNLFVEKGSVTVDGVSLTVARCHAPVGSGAPLQWASDYALTFDVALIPHTMKVTTLGQLKVGDAVNVEADLIGKYVARWLEPNLVENVNKAGLSLPFLAEHGYT